MSARMRRRDLFGNAKVAELAYVLPSAPTDPDAHALMLGQHRPSAIGCRCWPCCLGSLAMLGYRFTVADVDHAARWPRALAVWWWPRAVR